MNKTELYRSILALHVTLDTQTIRNLRSTYEDALLVPTKGAIPKILREAFPDIGEKLAAMQQEILLKQKKTTNAPMWFLAAYGTKRTCHMCSEVGFFGLGDRPHKDELVLCSHNCTRAYGRRCAEEQFGGNVFSTEAFKEKRTRYLQDKYGDHVTGPTKVPGAAEKIKRTSLQRYGETHFARAEAVQAKRVATNQKLYGGNGPQASKEVKQKSVASMLARHGVEHPSQVEHIKRSKKAQMDARTDVEWGEIRAKIEATNMQRYGVRHLAHDPEFSERVAKGRTKKMKWRGHVVSYQGYENRILSLFEFDPNVIGVSLNRKFIGTLRYDDNRIYYPDIKVKFADGSQRVIEVKSTWWLGFDGDKTVNGDFFEKNCRKFEVAYQHYKNLGIEFVLALIVGSEVHWIKKPHLNLAAKVTKITRKP